MVNHLALQGRLVADPELRSTGSGVPVCSFRVAWSEKYKETETKLFLSCTAWRSTGELVSRYFTRGQEILVEGKLSTRDWTDQSGNKRQSVELTVDRVHFCGPKVNGSESGYPADPGAGYRAAGSPVNVDAGEFAELTDDDGELPF